MTKCPHLALRKCWSSGNTNNPLKYAALDFKMRAPREQQMQGWAFPEVFPSTKGQILQNIVNCCESLPQMSYQQGETEAYHRKKTTVDTTPGVQMTLYQMVACFPGPLICSKSYFLPSNVSSSSTPSPYEEGHIGFQIPLLWSPHLPVMPPCT